jgi:hypothetical protein
VSNKELTRAALGPAASPQPSQLNAVLGLRRTGPGAHGSVRCRVVERKVARDASLKKWYAQPGDRFEVPVDGFVIDIVRDDLLLDIQTGGPPSQGAPSAADAGVGQEDKSA